MACESDVSKFWSGMLIGIILTILFFLVIHIGHSLGQTEFCNLVLNPNYTSEDCQEVWSIVTNKSKETLNYTYIINTTFNRTYMTNITKVVYLNNVSFREALEDCLDRISCQRLLSQALTYENIINNVTYINNITYNYTTIINKTYYMNNISFIDALEDCLDRISCRERLRSFLTYENITYINNITYYIQNKTKEQVGQDIESILQQELNIKLIKKKYCSLYGVGCESSENKTDLELLNKISQLEAKINNLQQPAQAQPIKKTDNKVYLLGIVVMVGIALVFYFERRSKTTKQDHGEFITKELRDQILDAQEKAK